MMNYKLPSRINRRFLQRRLLVLACLAFLLMTACSPSPGRNTLTIGISEEPRTLNIWLASDANSKKILSLVYQNLYIRDPDTLDLVPWLAESLPDYDPQTLSYTVRIRPALWSDGSPVTSEDLAFTVNLIKQFRIPRFYSRWQCVKSVAIVDDRTVRFYLDSPRALFLSRTLSIPVVAKSEWGPVAARAESMEKPLTALLNHRIDSPMGCGPFLLRQRREGDYLAFEANPLFFGRNLTINNYRLGPFVNKLIFRVYSSADVAILALKKGNIDFHWSDIQPGHMKGLTEHPDTHVYINGKSALYFMGFNLRKPPFSDPSMRRAIAMVIDKQFIITRILQGYATPMDSIIPQGNSFWHNPGLPGYCKDLPFDQRITRAYTLLKNSGYTWDTPPVNENGEIQNPSRIRLPDGRPMDTFTILTPPADYDPHRAACGTIIQEWLKTLGMPAVSRPMSFGALLERIKSNHDFDTFILGYGKLTIDPDYLGSFFHSANNRPRGWNMSGYANAEFDRLADASSRAVSQKGRQALVWKMQDIIMNDLPYIPLYNPEIIEAVNTGTYSGWVEMVGGIGNLWSLCTVKQQQG